MKPFQLFFRFSYVLNWSKIGQLCRIKGITEKVSKSNSPFPLYIIARCKNTKITDCICMYMFKNKFNEFRS